LPLQSIAAVQSSLPEGRGAQERQEAAQGGVAGAVLIGACSRALPSGAAPAVFRQAGGLKAVLPWALMGAYICTVTSSIHYADEP